MIPLGYAHAVFEKKGVERVTIHIPPFVPLRIEDDHVSPGFGHFKTGYGYKIFGCMLICDDCGTVKKRSAARVGVIGNR